MLFSSSIVTCQLPFEPRARGAATPADRSEEHTSELQSQSNIVCRLLLEKKNHQQCLLGSRSASHGLDRILGPRIGVLLVAIRGQILPEVPFVVQDVPTYPREPHALHLR